MKWRLRTSLISILTINQLLEEFGLKEGVETYIFSKRYLAIYRGFLVKNAVMLYLFITQSVAMIAPLGLVWGVRIEFCT